MQFLKENLKPFMVVMLADRSLYMVVMVNDNDCNKMILVNNNSWHGLNSYKDDLTNQRNDDFDIIAVYGSSEHFIGALNISMENRQLLCERERRKVKRLTVDEVSELLGYEVEIIRESNI